MIVNVHRKNTPNRGDLESAPCKYLVPQTDIHYIDILECRENNEKVVSLLEKASIIIYGGGGLLDHDKFRDNFEFLKNHYIDKLVIWGAGTNAISADTKLFDLSGIRFVGIRDRYAKTEVTNNLVDWVPCASCLHPWFDYFSSILARNHRTLNSLSEAMIGIFVNNAGSETHHNFQESQLYSSKQLGNHKTNLFDILAFFSSSDILVTNSYHGVYWAMLLGIDVFARKTSNKFNCFKHEIKLLESTQWDRHIYTYNQTSILSECRAANYDFFNKLKGSFEVLKKYSLAPQMYNGNYVVQHIKNDKLMCEFSNDKDLLVLVSSNVMDKSFEKYLNLSELAFRGFNLIFVKKNQNNGAFSIQKKQSVIGFNGSYISQIERMDKSRFVFDEGVYIINYSDYVSHMSSGYTEFDLSDFFLNIDKTRVAVIEME